MNKKNHQQEKRSTNTEQLKHLPPLTRGEGQKNVPKAQKKAVERDLTWDTHVGQHNPVPANPMICQELGRDLKDILLMHQATWDNDRVSHAVVPDKNQVTDLDLPDLGQN